MLLSVGGDMLKTPRNKEEMQAHLNLVAHAWNLSLFPEEQRKAELRKFIESQRAYAPNEEALQGLEWEYRRIMKQKDTLYPSVRKKITFAQAREVAKNDYVIRAEFID